MSAYIRRCAIVQTWYCRIYEIGREFIWPGLPPEKWFSVE